MMIIDKIKARLVDDARQMVYWWSVRCQMISAALTGWMWFDPRSLLWVLNMIPPQLRAVMPGGTVVAVMAVVFFLNIASILSRPIKQKPKGKPDVAV